MESLRLYRPDHAREHVVKVISSTSVNSAEGITKVLGTISSVEGHLVHLVVKTPRLLYLPGEMPEDKRDKPAEVFFEIWKRLKAANLPVVNNMWLLSDEAVAMTDLTAKGGTTFDRNSLFDLMVNRRAASPEDASFMNIDLVEVNAQVDELAQKASESKVAISFDDPMSLIIYPDGRWRIVLLDIGGTRFNYSNAQEHNKQAANRFKSSLEGIRFGFSHQHLL